VALPKGEKDTTLVKVKCTKGRFKNLDTNKSVNVANVACSGMACQIGNVIFLMILLMKTSSSLKIFDFFSFRKISCPGKGLEPIVKVVADSVFKSCANQGVDGRSHNLIGQLILVQIGWNIPDFGFQSQVAF